MNTALNALAKYVNAASPSKNLSRLVMSQTEEPELTGHKLKCALSVHQNENRRLPILALLLFCTACGTFPISGKIYSPSDKTIEQKRIDILACRAQAKNAASTASQQAVPSFLGMTIIGAYVANEAGKPKQREAFAQCMEARRYSVTPPNDDEPSKDDISS